MRGLHMRCDIAVVWEAEHMCTFAQNQTHKMNTQRHTTTQGGTITVHTAAWPHQMSGLVLPDTNSRPMTTERPPCCPPYRSGHTSRLRKCTSVEYMYRVMLSPMKTSFLRFRHCRASAAARRRSRQWLGSQLRRMGDTAVRQTCVWCSDCHTWSVCGRSRAVCAVDAAQQPSCRTRLVSHHSHTCSARRRRRPMSLRQSSPSAA